MAPPKTRKTVWLPALVLGVALAILGAAIIAGYRHLQSVVRQQLVNRDGEILYAVAQGRQLSQPLTNLAERLKSPAEQMLLALQISKLNELNDHIIGVRLFDISGHFVTAFPLTVTDATLDPPAVGELARFRPASRYRPQAEVKDYFLLDPTTGQVPSNSLPMLEVSIPIHAGSQGPLLAAVQLLMDARELAAQLARFESRLQVEACWVFFCAGLLLTGVLFWAYRRLQTVNQLLHERTDHLLRANHELTLAAKTGALGAVTAHLIHGLSNPLANLQDFMASRGESHPDDLDWQDAAAATRRMQSLVHEVVRVLGEQDSQDNYEMSVVEMADILAAKLRPSAEKFEVRCEFAVTAQGRLSNHQANLILLILENLALNAMQVTPKGKRVRLSVRPEGAGTVCEVADQGPGFPAALVKRMFIPCRSTKGGAGLGLAISNQLAAQLNGRLELRQNEPGGAVMGLVLPWLVPMQGRADPETRGGRA